MKSSFVYITITLLLFTAVEIKAQSVGKLFPKGGFEDTVKNIVKFDLLGANNRRASVSYERYLGKRNSITVGVATRASIPFNSVDGMALGANVGFRHYVSKNKSPLEGIYISPQLTFSNYNYVSNSNWSNGSFYRYEIKSTEIGANFLIGKQVVSRKGLTLDLYTGIGAKYIVGETHTTTQAGSSNSFLKEPAINIPFGLNIGFGW